jgi:hypothetical protein
LFEKSKVPALTSKIILRVAKKLDKYLQILNNAYQHPIFHYDQEDSAEFHSRRGQGVLSLLPFFQTASDRWYRRFFQPE